MTLSSPSRRALLTSAFTVAASALLAGCGGDPVDPTKGDAAPAGCPNTTVADPTAVTAELADTLALTGTSLFYIGKVKSGSDLQDAVGVVSLDGGSPQLVSTEGGGALGLAAEDQSSYFASGSMIVRNTVGGATTHTFFTNMGYIGRRIALDATSYYVTLDNGTTGIGAILRGPKAGGPTSIVVTLTSSSPFLRALQVDGKNIYFVSFDGFTGATLWRAPVEGGAPVELVHNLSSAAEIAVDDTSVYYFTPPGQPASLMKIAKEGGTPVELLAGLNLPHGLAVTSDAIYATDINPPPTSFESNGDSNIHKVLKTGECATLLATKQTLTRFSFQSLVANETSVYWGTPDGIRKTPR
jgi:hypothetical protein